MIQLSLILFTVGTIVCATAYHVATILVGRTLQGVGGGGLLTMTYVVMADLLTLRERAKGFAVISTTWVRDLSHASIFHRRASDVDDWRKITMLVQTSHANLS